MCCMAIQNGMQQNTALYTDEVNVAVWFGGFKRHVTF